MTFRVFKRLTTLEQGYGAITRLWEEIKPILSAGQAVDVRATIAKRTLDQNAKQWPYLEGFSQQLVWPVNGKMAKMEPDEWKDVLTAAFHNDTVRLAQGLNGGVVMLGQRTSKFKEPQFREWMAFLKATAADRGVEPVYAADHPVSIDSE